MGRTSLFRKILSVAFAATVVFTVSVREVHYLFSQHEINEHCENHLHSGDAHGDCAICKFDVSLFTDNVQCPQLNQPLFHVETIVAGYRSVTLHFEVSSNALRGPPQLV